MNKPKFLIVHHTGGTDLNPKEDTSNHTFEVVNAWHKKLWNFKSSKGHYIGYHYFIDKAGKLTNGRADTDEGAHTIGKNNSSIGICLAGNFDVTMPTKEQIETLKILLRVKMTEYGIPLENIVPHRKFANKSCYGTKLSDDWVANILIKETPAPVVSNSAIVDDIKKHLEIVDTLLGKIK